MRKCQSFLIFILFASFLHSQNIVPMPQLKRPQKMAIDEQQLYVTEGATIFIFSTDDFKFKKKFGKEGAGPGEMRPMPHIEGAKIEISLQDNEISAFSRNKISYYSKNGEYLREIKAVYGLWHKPLGDIFVGRGTLTEDGIYYLTINFYDKNFKIIKEICRFKSANQQGKKIPAVGFKPSTYFFENEKIFVDDRNEGLVHVFDNKGNKLYDITIKPKRIPFTGDNKDAYYNYYRNHPVLKDQWQQFKNRFEFPDQFPYFKTLNVADNKLYVQTYKTNGDKSQFLIYDLKGKLLKDIMLPMVAENASEDFPYIIYHGKIYQLVEDIDQEEWFLHITPIK